MSLAVSSLGVAVVTGAARGIGRAVALRLAKDGYDVGLNDLPTAAESLEGVAKEITALGRRPYIALGDVSVSANVQNILSTTVENLGELNVLSEWDKVLSVNALSTFLCYKYAALQMIKQGKGGSIIGASSVAGRQAYANAALYSASKFAIRGLTQAAGK
ncbi:hypothetical protein H0H81_002158 [Sphagnurus paluster]|uniref:Uncharacterized protein n=1 Tax=Sphagnurus paluster TaxID=117069 RepID=A0A9P7K5S0_9AGAR|nr:hypothetical protein H0H81_002158 [Sphagnurus paluster]